MTFDFHPEAETEFLETIYTLGKRQETDDDLTWKEDP